MYENARMLIRVYNDAFPRRALCLLGVFLVVSIGLVPRSLTVCLGAGDEACACCTEPVVSELGCCVGDSAPVADAGTNCCIELAGSPMPWLASAPSVSLVMATVSPTLLPTEALFFGRLSVPTGPPIRPPAPVPLHIQFCCPLT